MQASSTKQELSSFPGMVNYPSQFIPAMSDLTSNLRELPNKNVLFQWTDCQEQDVQKLKYNISSNVNLFKQVILQEDASKRGLEAVLTQKESEGKEKQVAHTSKSLAPAETSYVDIA